MTTAGLTVPIHPGTYLIGYSAFLFHGGGATGEQDCYLNTSTNSGTVGY
ncbi:MAG TPA: hypothetical protein VHZ06_05005 [Marmoricola sp.]|nr:hypothetical protein [Marmoricola sp.]